MGAGGTRRKSQVWNMIWLLSPRCGWVEEASRRLEQICGLQQWQRLGHKCQLYGNKSKRVLNSM